jgi:hypothetical protein
VLELSDVLGGAGLVMRTTGRLDSHSQRKNGQLGANSSTDGSGRAASGRAPLKRALSQQDIDRKNSNLGWSLIEPGRRWIKGNGHEMFWYCFDPDAPVGSGFARLLRPAPVPLQVGGCLP